MTENEDNSINIYKSFEKFRSEIFHLTFPDVNLNQLTKKDIIIQFFNKKEINQKNFLFYCVTEAYQTTSEEHIHILIQFPERIYIRTKIGLKKCFGVLNSKNELIVPHIAPIPKLGYTYILEYFMKEDIDPITNFEKKFLFEILLRAQIKKSIPPTVFIALRKLFSKDQSSSSSSSNISNSSNQLEKIQTNYENYEEDEQLIETYQKQEKQLKILFEENPKLLLNLIEHLPIDSSYILLNNKLEQVDRKDEKQFLQIIINNNNNNINIENMNNNYSDSSKNQLKEINQLKNQIIELQSNDKIYKNQIIELQKKDNIYQNQIIELQSNDKIYKNQIIELEKKLKTIDEKFLNIINNINNVNNKQTL